VEKGGTRSVRRTANDKKVEGRWGRKIKILRKKKKHEKEGDLVLCPCTQLGGQKRESPVQKKTPSTVFGWGRGNEFVC